MWSPPEVVDEAPPPRRPERRVQLGVVHDETHVDEVETERVDAFDDAVERGLVHELPLKHRHPFFAPQFELRKGGPRHRSRLTAECELIGLGHDAATAALLEVRIL